jgi:hypothetical protein
MGNIYYAVCLDCKESFELGKRHYDMTPTPPKGGSLEEGVQEAFAYIEHEDLRLKQIHGQTYSFKDEWIRAALRFHWFVEKHLPCNIYIGNDTDRFIGDFAEKHAYEKHFFQEYPQVGSVYDETGE